MCKRKISARHLLYLGIACSAITVQSTLAQNTITINPNVQRFIENTSDFDRSKYLQGHFWFIQNKQDPDFVKFKNDYNIADDYYGSRIFWNPIGTIKNGNIPAKRPKRYSGERDVIKYVATGNTRSLFHDRTVDYSQVDVLPKTKEMATFTAESFRDSWEFVPNLFEPFNEPMVHAGDYYPGANNKAKSDLIITKICEFYREIGKAIHKVPELNKITVMGYASAFPEFEAQNFGLWNSRYKKFIDIAGEDLDAFSVHLYDGVGVNNSGGRRSGSNSEAILDLIEAYSYEKLNVVKPYAVTEYGRLVASQPGWTEGGTVSNYEPVENSQAVRSQMHLAMSFMERGPKMLSAVPFSVGKGEPTKKFSRASLWSKIGDNKWELTPRKYFYEIWKDVKGKRVFINSENIDIQTQAFVDADKMYVVLNNLNDAVQTLKLNTVNLPELDDVAIKRVKIFANKVPELTTETLTTVPSELQIRYAETIVLTYNFKSNVPFDNKVTSKKYYANRTLKPIVANTNVSFTVENVEVGNGIAKLRLSVGRAHDKSLRPTVLINNKLVPISGDIIRGYDQANRRQFFGTLEIPFDSTFLKAGTNDIKVKFPDAGGSISSVIVQLEVFDKPVNNNSLSVFDLGHGDSSENSFNIFPNPATTILNISTKDVSTGGKPKRISIKNLQGVDVKILEMINDKTTIDISDLITGVYFVNIKTERTNVVKKLIVK